MDYYVKEDLELIKKLLGISWEDIATEIGVNRTTLMRTKSGDTLPNPGNIEKIYEYAFKKGKRLNIMKEMKYKEDIRLEEEQGSVLLFHGAKKKIEDKIDLVHAGKNNDFGLGFYCGETLEQSAMFIANYPNSSVYALKFNNTNLKKIEYAVDQKWMLTIAYFRGKLEQYKNTSVIQALVKKLEGVDYIIAPIADNRMFAIIDSYTNGEITDEQCKHALAATNLGMQYVFISQKSIDNLEILERCYLCSSEKEYYLKKNIEDSRINEDRVKIAKIDYRGKGQYIDEALKWKK